MSPVPETADLRAARRSALVTGLLLGVGLVGALDEIVLHQLLQWHNFYVHATRFWRVFVDGLFHAVTTALLVAGAVRLWRDRALLSRVPAWTPLGAGVLLGMGGFNLYDGIVQHKLLRLHPVREGVPDELPYDLAFNAVSLALLAAGWLLWRRARRAGR
jgi:uncharacterized membrane protein